MNGNGIVIFIGPRSIIRETLNSQLGENAFSFFSPFPKEEKRLNDKSTHSIPGLGADRACSCEFAKTPKAHATYRSERLNEKLHHSPRNQCLCCICTRTVSKSYHRSLALGCTYLSDKVPLSKTVIGIFIEQRSSWASLIKKIRGTTASVYQSERILFPRRI